MGSWQKHGFSLLHEKDLVTGAEVDAFKKEFGYLLVNLVEKILERSPLGSVIVRNASVLDPRDILKISTEEAEKKMKSILNHLKNLKLHLLHLFFQTKL